MENVTYDKETKKYYGLDKFGNSHPIPDADLRPACFGDQSDFLEDLMTEHLKKRDEARHLKAMMEAARNRGWLRVEVESYRRLSGQDFYGKRRIIPTEDTLPIVAGNATSRLINDQIKREERKRKVHLVHSS